MLQPAGLVCVLCQLTRIPGFQWTVEIKYGLQDNEDKVWDDMSQVPGLVCVLCR